MRWFLRDSTVGRDPLAVSMTGVRLGERALQIGPGDSKTTGALAAKAGLTGQAAIVVGDALAAARARRSLADASALADVHVGPSRSLPFETGSFDVAVIHDRNDFLSSMAPDDRAATLLECRRVLRPGGRVVVIGPGTATGLRRLAGGPRLPAGASIADLEAAGFRAARTLADREGVRFVEAVNA